MPQPLQSGAVQVSPDDSYYKRQSIEVGYFNPDAFGALAGEVWNFNPSPSIHRYSELRDAGNAGTGIYVDGEWTPGYVTRDGFVPTDPTEGNPTISAEEANRRAAGLGLTFDAPLAERQLEIMMERKSRERYRQYVLSRRRRGAGQALGDLFFGFAIGATDPLNVASAFIPIVGEAQFTALSARIGLTGARLVRGGAEGAVGATLVEPIIYANARFEQADYDLNDSLLNVAFGTVLGGGLHTGFGALGDALGRASPRTRQTTLRSAVSQFVMGRDVNVEPIVRADPAFSDPAHPTYARIQREAERVRRSDAQVREAEAELQRANAEIDRFRNEVDATTRDRESLVRARAEDGPALVERHLDSPTGQRLSQIEAELEAPDTSAPRRATLERERELLGSAIKEEMPLARGRADAEIRALEAHRSRTEARLESARAGRTKAEQGLQRASERASKASRRYREALEAGKTPEQLASEGLAWADQNQIQMARRIDRIAEEDTARIEGRNPVDPEIAAAKERAKRLADEETLQGIEDQAADLEAAVQQLVDEGELNEGALGDLMAQGEAASEIDMWSRAAKAVSVCLLRG